MLPLHGTPQSRSASTKLGQVYANTLRKWLTTRCWPSATMVSKSGGATACPTIATRQALISNPAFTPAASATAREVWSQASWFHSGRAASASASFASSSGTFGSFQNLSLAAWSMGNSSLKKARDHEEKSGRSRIRGRSKSTVRENQAWSLPSAPGAAPTAHSSFHNLLRFNSASTCGSNSSMGSFCKYCVLNHSSLARSNTPFVRLTPSSENLSINSFVRRYSSSFPGDQPSSARKFRNAY